jgi:hypothetical protein
MLPRKVIPFISRSYPDREYAERPLTILQVGRDQELLHLRAKVIGCAGFTVQSMTPDQVQAEIGKTRGPRVWVFCHTLVFYELALFAVAIRHTHPADKLLRLTGLNDIGQAPGLFDELLEPIRGVDELLRVVAALAQRSRSGKRYEHSPGNIGVLSKPVVFRGPVQWQQNRESRSMRLTIGRSAPANTPPMLIHDRFANPQP